MCMNVHVMQCTVIWCHTMRRWYCMDAPSRGLQGLFHWILQAKHGTYFTETLGGSYMYIYMCVCVRTNGTYECIQYSICRGLTTQNGYKTHKPGVEQYPNMYCIPTASYRFTFTYTHKYLHKLFSIHHLPMITNPPTNGIKKEKQHH